MFTIIQNGVKFGAFKTVARAEQWARSNLSESFKVERIC
jgi:hypothetical protein